MEPYSILIDTYLLGKVLSTAISYLLEPDFILMKSSIIGNVFFFQLKSLLPEAEFLFIYRSLVEADSISIYNLIIGAVFFQFGILLLVREIFVEYTALFTDSCSISIENYLAGV